MTLAKAVSMKYNKTIEKCSNEEIYFALLDMTKQMAEDKVSNEAFTWKWWSWPSGSMFC